MRDGRNDPVIALAQRLTDQLHRLRRRGSMNYAVNFTELAELLGRVEALAPEFETAFRQGNVATLRPRDGRRVEALVAIRTLEATLKHQPDAWFLHLMLAYYLLSDRGDDAGAARELGEAAAHPDAPFYVRSLARRLGPEGAAKGDDPVGELRLFRQMSQVQAAVDAYRSQEGRLPSSVDEALGDAAGRELLSHIEVDLALTPEGQVTTRESQHRDQLAQGRLDRFERVRPYRLPEY